jgi:N-acetylmuramoyl-L-alanine amidase
MPCALGAPQLAAPRTNAYAGYTRLVVDVPAGVTHRLEPLGAVLRVTFPGTAFAGTGTTSVNKPELSGYTAFNGSGNAVLQLVTPQGVSARSGFKASILEPSPGKTGYRLVLDVSGAYADTTKLLNPPELRLAVVPARAFTVVLDPGHGGPDTGALGNGLREDSFNLGMAMRVKIWLERVPGVRVELTRTGSGVFSSDKRTDLNARAQTSRGKTVFVSLHANAVPRASWNSQFGIETYYYNPNGARPQYVAALPPATVSPAGASSQPAPPPVQVSAPQQQVSPPPPDPQTAPEETVAPGPLEPTPPPPSDAPPPEDADLPVGVPSAVIATPESVALPPTTDPTSSPDAPLNPLEEPGAPSTQAQPVFQPLPNPTTVVPLPLPVIDRTTASRTLAGSIQARLLFATGANNRGVRSADFYVIKYAECPSVLVETGFVTHPVEAQMLKNPNYLERLSYGVASGITAYLNDLSSAP